MVAAATRWAPRLALGPLVAHAHDAVDRKEGETMLKRGAKQLVAEANAQVQTISAAEGLKLVGDPDVVFVDVRETVERQKTGGVKGSVHVPRGFLEFFADPESPSHVLALSSGKRIVLYCAAGGRSALAAKTLGEMGVERVCHMAGGFGAWREAGGPIET
jgi:rhodanese-related sulfurtransferase